MRETTKQTTKSTPKMNYRKKESNCNQCFEEPKLYSLLGYTPGERFTTNLFSIVSKGSKLIYTCVPI